MKKNTWGKELCLFRLLVKQRPKEFLRTVTHFPSQQSWEFLHLKLDSQLPLINIEKLRQKITSTRILSGFMFNVH